MFTTGTLEILFVLLLLFPLIIFLLRWGILLGKRALLPYRLSRFANKNGFQITWLRPKLFSLFHTDAGFDFTLTAKDKTYHVTVLSARHRFREHSFLSEKRMDVYRDFRFRRPTAYSRRNLRRQSVSVGIWVKNFPLHLGEKVPEQDLKILLFYPVAKIVSRQKDGKKQFLDSGSELFSDTYLFSLTAFFRQVKGEMNYLRKTKPWEME